MPCVQYLWSWLSGYGSTPTAPTRGPSAWGSRYTAAPPRVSTFIYHAEGEYILISRRGWVHIYITRRVITYITCRVSTYCTYIAQRVITYITCGVSTYSYLYNAEGLYSSRQPRKLIKFAIKKNWFRILNPVLWIKIHWIWIQNFGPIWIQIRIHCYGISFEERKEFK